MRIHKKRPTAKSEITSTLRIAAKKKCDLQPFIDIVTTLGGFHQTAIDLVVNKILRTSKA
jgi:hypothetical protein